MALGIRQVNAAEWLRLIIRIAQFSDVHLGPMPVSYGFRHFALKRLIGSVSWHFRRKNLHDPGIAEALCGDLLAARPDHIVCSGDLVNISAPEEFVRAASYLEKFGPPERLSFCPGNHDAYVPLEPRLGLDHFNGWLVGELKRQLDEDAPHFPIVRLCRNVAIISLNSALPQALFSAAGTLGDKQIGELAILLDDLRQRGFYRMVNLHHCPLPGVVKSRKALTDASKLQRVLEQHGAELVVYGHTHRYRGDVLTTATGDLPVISVASGSSNGSKGHQPAQWHLFEITRLNRNWVTTLQSRNWNSTTKTFDSGPKISLSLD